MRKIVLLSEIAHESCKAALWVGVTRPLALLVLLMLYGPPAVPAWAQDTPLPWRENLTCDPALQRYSGIEYCTGLAGDAHVLVVDLHESGVRFEYVIAWGLDRYDDPEDAKPHECEDVNIPDISSGPGCYDPSNESYYPVMSLLETVRLHEDAALVINTDYGAYPSADPKTRGHGPEGFTVVQTNRIDGPLVNDTDNNAERRPWLAIGSEPPLRAEFGQFPPGEDDGTKPEWVYTGFGGAPWLIREGEIDDEIDDCTNAELHSCVSDVAQTAVALSEDGRWLYLVLVKGRDAQGTADFLLRTLSPSQAIKLDGGGSSQLWYGGMAGDGVEDRVVVAGDGRQLSQYLAVFAAPGKGIVIEPTPELPEEMSWWERTWHDLTQGLKEWWEAAKTDLKEWWEASQTDLKEWWEKTREDQEEKLQEWLANLAEWVAREILQQINELCGGAALSLALVVGPFLAARRRSHRG
jgi:hypothetical protein